MQTPKRKRYQKDTAPTDDIITLIHLVRQNPALYNYKLQPNQRRRADVLNGWATIAAQIGNRYTVEECRRKWKNLRDTYHQYRLRKPKHADSGLAKWRYAKDLEFLSTVYQPKLKSNRTQNYTTHTLRLSTPIAQDDDVQDDDQDDEPLHAANSIVHHSSGITLVNDVAETFILTNPYEESVNDDESMDHHQHHHHHHGGSHDDDDPTMTHMELTHSTDLEDVEFVKQEHTHLDDDDGATGAEVDYEEVCVYEETGNGPSVDCETIIAGGGQLVRSSSTDADAKAFHYIGTNEFCIENITTHTQLSSSGSSSIIGSIKLKNVAVSNNTATTLQAGTMVAAEIVDSGVEASLSENTQTREELDLFFDFLKKKMQRFTKQEITAIQVEFLNCVLRHEAEQAPKGDSDVTDSMNDGSTRATVVTTDHHIQNNLFYMPPSSESS